MTNSTYQFREKKNNQFWHLQLDLAEIAAKNWQTLADPASEQQILRNLKHNATQPKSNQVMPPPPPPIGCDSKLHKHIRNHTHTRWFFFRAIFFFKLTPNKCQLTTAFADGSDGLDLGGASILHPTVVRKGGCKSCHYFKKHMLGHVFAQCFINRRNVKCFRVG